jgi:hypothetical protein
VNPIDALDATQRIGEPVERIAYDTVDTPDTGLLQRFHHEVGSGSRHVDIPLCRRGCRFQARHKHTRQGEQGFRRTAGTVTFARTRIEQESARAGKIEKAG